MADLQPRGHAQLQLTLRVATQKKISCLPALALAAGFSLFLLVYAVVACRPCYALREPGRHPKKRQDVHPAFSFCAFVDQLLLYVDSPSLACAAASRAMGTRGPEHDT